MNRAVLHPFLFGAFPILFLFTHNASQFSLDAIAVPIAVSWLFALLSLGLLRGVLGDVRKAGLIVSLFLLLFFSYGHAYGGMADVRVLLGRVALGAHEVLFPIFGALFLAGVWVALRMRESMARATGSLNVVAGCLVAFSAAQTMVGEFRSEGWAPGPPGSPAGAAPVQGDLSPGHRPDIYYIVLDGYGREDVLKELFEFDNSSMLKYLQSRGFYIAGESRANYSQTSLSLAASLNGQYLNELASHMGGGSDNRRPLMGLIRDSFVADFLEDLGYIQVAFASGYEVTEIPKADVYRSPGWFANEFLSAVFNTTPLPAVVNKLSGVDPFDMHRQRILYTLDHFPDQLPGGGPKFVFAHVVAPHPPFVFGPSGEERTPKLPYIEQGDGNHLIRNGGITREQYVRRYRDQLQFINGQLKEALDRILENSPRPPVIILQGDHGPGSLLDQESEERTDLRERLAILNALLVPGAEDSELYPEISPVNTFRMIFNLYFGTQYELLDDRSYFSPWSQPYRFIDVTDVVITSDPDGGRSLGVRGMVG